MLIRLSRAILTDILVRPPCSSTLPHPQTATETELHTLLLTSLLISGSVTWSQWTGGASSGSTKVSLHGLDGSPSTICTQVSLNNTQVKTPLTDCRLECVGTVRCTFKSSRYLCSAIADIACRLIPCNKHSHSMRYAHPTPSKYLYMMASRSTKSLITSAT